MQDPPAQREGVGVAQQDGCGAARRELVQAVALLHPEDAGVRGDSHQLRGAMLSPEAL
jgi:hypothetical protein